MGFGDVAKDLNRMLMMFPWTFDTIQKLTRYSLCAKIDYVPKKSPTYPHSCNSLKTTALKNSKKNLDFPEVVNSRVSLPMEFFGAGLDIESSHNM